MLFLICVGLFVWLCFGLLVLLFVLVVYVYCCGVFCEIGRVVWFVVLFAVLLCVLGCLVWLMGYVLACCCLVVWWFVFVLAVNGFWFVIVLVISLFLFNLLTLSLWFGLVRLFVWCGLPLAGGLFLITWLFVGLRVGFAFCFCFVLIG